MEKSREFQIGLRFVKEYYHRLNTIPEKLSEFFDENALFTIGGLSSTVKPVTSHAEISKAFQEQNFKESVVTIFDLDCQESIEGSIFIVVTGTIATPGHEPRKFSQSFLLIHQKSSHYCVNNSVFRYLDPPSAIVTPQVAHESTSTANEPQPATDQNQTGSIESPVEGEKDDEVVQAEPVVENKVLQSQSPVETTHNQVTQPPVQQQNVPKKPFSWASLVSPGSEGSDKGVTAVPPSAPEEKPTKKTIPPKADDHGKSPFNSIYISNLPNSGVTENKIEEIFSKMGDILKITLRLEKGFCFVDYKSTESAKKALDYANKNPITLNGKQITVSEKKIKSDREGSSSGSGSGSGNRDRTNSNRGNYSKRPNNRDDK